ncbi:MAG: signal peptidase I [Ignavibacteriales bacterium]
MSTKQKNLVEKIINWLLNILIVIFGIVLLVSIYTGIQTRILGNKYANFFGYSTFEVQTGSMADAINAGDWIIVKLTQKVKLKDVITYELDGEYITHRVIEIYNGKYTTKGDANSAKDKSIKQEQIVGKVVNVLGNFGIVRKILFNPGVLISFMVTLFLFNSAIKKNKNEESKKETNYFGKLVNLIINKFKSKKKVEVKVEEPVVEPIVEEEKVIDEAIEDELAKTSLYRVIPVDLSEIDDTFLEIAKNELKEAEQKNLKKDTATEVVEDPIDEDDSLTKINLELLKDKKGNKKSKNVIETAMFIKGEELDELVNILLGEEAARVGALTIRNSLIDTYINTKYYNLMDEKVTGKNLVKQLEKDIIDSAIELIDKYNGKNEKYSDMVNMHAHALTLIAKLEYVKDSVNETKAKNEFYQKEVSKRYKDWEEDRIETVVDGINKIQRNYNNMLEYLLKSLETNMFNLTFNKLSMVKDMYGLELEHNISFSRVYSDYIIDKTYAEGIIAEDKTSVLLNLLSIQIIRDMMTFNSNKKYLLYIPNTLYTKEKKLNKVLKMFDDKYAKNNVIILVSGEELLSNKTTIKSVRKMGYRYAIVFDKEKIINAKERGNIYVADYIFIDKKIVDVEKTLSFIPEELLGSVIYEDVVNKVGGFGSE